MPIYKAIYDGPPKAQTADWLASAASKLFIIVHSTESSGTASGEAGYAKRRTDGTSSHYYVDGSRVVQSTNTDLSANGVGSSKGNQRGIHYEFCGRASWSRATWLKNINWEAAAAQIAVDCAHWGIPVRRLTVAQLRGLGKGVTTHNDCRQAFGGTDHTDPGGNFPMDHLLALVGSDDGDDMQLSDTVKLTKGQAAMLADDPGVQDGIAVNTAIGGSYAFSRVNSRALAAVQQEQAAAKARDLAILEAVKGVDTQAILAHIDELAAQEKARDEALLNEVKRLASGGATAEEIVDLVAARLAA